MLRIFNNSSSHWPALMSQSIVRDALLKSVTCCFPPVSFQTSHESIVPNASFPCSACFRASGTLSRIQRSLLPEK